MVQKWKVSRQQTKSSRIGDPTGRNVEPCIVFKLINNYPPEYLRDLFRLRGNIKNLRGVTRNKVQVPKPNATCYGKISVKYLAAITWNKISDTLRSLSTLPAVRELSKVLVNWKWHVWSFD